MPLLAGTEPTGVEVSWTFIHIWRVEDDQIVEHWACRDDLGLLHQIGAWPPALGRPLAAVRIPTDYRNKHVPLAAKAWGIDGAEIDRGIDGPYVSAVHFKFESLDAMTAAMGGGGHRRGVGRCRELHIDRASAADQRDRGLTSEARCFGRRR